MSRAEPEGTTSAASAGGGKYLTFTLAGEDYGLEIHAVREIVGMLKITAVPRTPEHVRGVINLRGKVIPVIDLRLKFGLPAAALTDESCIIVVDVNGAQLGIVVDQVCEVLDIPTESIANAPAFGSRVDTAFISGMGKTENRLTILLDIAIVLSGRDVAWAREAVEDGDAQAI